MSEQTDAEFVLSMMDTAYKNGCCQDFHFCEAYEVVKRMAKQSPTPSPEVERVVEALRDALKAFDYLASKGIVDSDSCDGMREALTALDATRNQPDQTEGCTERFSLCLDCAYHNRCKRYSQHRDEVDATRKDGQEQDKQ